jgi:pimeloyl-ACP methyl ester carboxylesterase
MYAYSKQVAENALPKLTRIVLDVQRRNHIKPSECRFHVGGHSLGAAAAQLLALGLRWSISPHVGVFTFGASRFGNAGFNRLFLSPELRMRRFFRIYNHDDFIPTLPALRRGYIHLDELMARENTAFPDHRTVDLQAGDASGMSGLPSFQRTTLAHLTMAFRVKGKFEVARRCGPGQADPRLRHRVVGWLGNMAFSGFKLRERMRRGGGRGSRCPSRRSRASRRAG